MSLIPTKTGYALGYEGVKDFQDIRLKQADIVTTSADSGGSIQVQGRNVTITDGSAIKTIVTGSEASGSLSVNASESVQLIGTTADGQSPSALSTQTKGAGNAGNLVIETGQLILRDGAQVSASTLDKGQGGIGNAGNLVLISRDGDNISNSTSDTVPIPEPSSILGILTFAAFSATKVLKRKQRNRQRKSL